MSWAPPPTAPPPSHEWGFVPVCVALLLGQHLLSTSCLPDAGIRVGSSGLDMGGGCFLLPGFLYTGVSLSLLSLCLPAFLPSPTRFLGAHAVAPRGPASPATIFTNYVAPQGPGTVPAC